MPIDYAQLKSEIENDPRGYGYAPFINMNDNVIRDMLNRVRNGSAGTVPSNPTADSGQANGIITVPVLMVSPMQILSVIDVRDLPGTVNAAQAAWFESVMQTQGASLQLANVDGSKTFIRQNIDRAVGNAQGSQTRLDTLAVKSGSRVEELSFRNSWGVYTVTSNDVATALRG